MEICKVGLTEFPRIGNLHGESIETRPSKLQFVSVEECESLTLPKGCLLLQIHYIRTIHVLHISDCKELESAPLFDEMINLRELSIRNCPKLRASSETEGKNLSPSLKKLIIKQCGDLVHFLIKSLHGLVNLSELVLENCPGLLSLPSADVCKSLTSLKFLKIIGCEDLSSFGGLSSLCSLVELKISSCSKLAAPPVLGGAASGPANDYDDDVIEEENPVLPVSSLQIDYLEVDLPCVLNIEPLSSLCHTKGLVIGGGTQLESLPEQWLLQNHKELQSLKVLCASSLESLPLSMRDLRALNFLLLSGAGKLTSLPDMPSSLRWLHVIGCCPELVTQIRVKDSPEWKKISTIPKVHIAAAKTVQSCPHIFHGIYASL